ncbi:hypothetical protein EB118_11150 [bacterium]|nr:hypothetical protein [bacterium]
MDIDDNIIKVLPFHNNYVQQLQEALNKIDRDQIIDATKLAFVGFDGGHIMEYNDAKSFVYVPSNNYGIIEDCHQIIMHSIAQFFRTNFNNNKNKLNL